MDELFGAVKVSGNDVEIPGLDEVGPGAIVWLARNVDILLAEGLPSEEDRLWIGVWAEEPEVVVWGVRSRNKWLILCGGD